MTDFRPIARTGLPPVKPALASRDPADLPRAAYLHIPFCHRRCFYCDFPVVPLGDRADGAQGSGAPSVAAYLALLHQEIAQARPGPPLSTVYLGGGTPSLLAPAQVGALLEALQHRFGIAPGAEITLEADRAGWPPASTASAWGGKAWTMGCWRPWGGATGALTWLKPRHGLTAPKGGVPCAAGAWT